VTYRTGNHWGVTIVREGQVAHAWRPFNVGNTVCAEAGCAYDEDEHPGLVAVVVNGGQALAERICALLNADAAGVFACDQCDDERYHRHLPARPYTESTVEDWDWPRADSCTCPKALTGRIMAADPDCPVHHGRRARGPKPPPVGPGCICDGSGRTCPRHGAVI
jgi:hypothetical protein